MIVRILDEGQFRLDSGYLDRLNQIDNMLVAVLAEGGDVVFEDLFQEMLAVVREYGERLPDDELATSDVVLPSASARLDELRALFTGEGVVPG